MLVTKNTVKVLTVTCRVKAASAGPPSHLNIFGRQQGAKLLAVMLPNAVEDDSAGGHVDAHGEGLCGEQKLDPAVGEAALHYFLKDHEIFPAIRNGYRYAFVRAQCQNKLRKRHRNGTMQIAPGFIT